MQKTENKKNKNFIITVSVLLFLIIAAVSVLSAFYLSENGWPKIFNAVGDNMRTYIASYDVSASENDSVTLAITDDNIAVISGKGKMKDFKNGPDIPWIAYRDKIYSIEIEQGITHIGAYSFTRCPSFKELTIPDGVDSIGEFAFADCKSLQNINISPSVYSVGECAFYRCENLHSVKMPISITCGDNVFSIDEALKNVTIIKGNYDDYNYSDDDVEMYRYPWYASGEITVTFDNSINTIPAYMFYKCDSISTIILNASPIKDIGSHAFADSSITSCTLPEGVQSIGDSAFLNCHNLTSFIVPGSVSSISPSCFSDCTGLETFAFGLPSAMTVIPKQMFFNCRALSEILLPAGISEIQANAFSNCTSLAKVIFPDDAHIKKFGDRTFSNCSSLEEIFFPETEELGVGILSDCVSLSKVIITSEITSIPDGFCSGCKALQTIIVPKTIESIGKSAFALCKSLQNFSFPNELSKIGPFAFQYTGLKEATLGDKIKEIDSCTFRGCSKLTKISIGSNVEKIGYSAFSESDISNLYIPDSVKEIKYDAFGHCNKLEFIEIGQNIRNITYNIFYADRNIRQITFHNKKEDISIDERMFTENIAFDDTRCIFLSQ